MHSVGSRVRLARGQLRIQGITNKKARTAELKSQIKDLETKVKSDPDLTLKKPQVLEYRNWIKTTKSAVDTLPGGPLASGAGGDGAVASPGGGGTDSAAVILLGLIQRSNLPTISRVVDSMNLISVRHGVAISIWDADKVQGEISYKLSKGGEKYWPFMGEQELSLLEDELIGVDESGVCRCLVRYRDSKYAAVSVDTKNIIVHMQGINISDDADIMAPLEELRQLLVGAVGGDVTDISMKKMEF